MRPLIKGPRSFTLTTTDLPFAMWVTRIIVPRGSSRCAADKPFMSYISPLAVGRP